MISEELLPLDVLRYVLEGPLHHTGALAPSSTPTLTMHLYESFTSSLRSPSPELFEDGVCHLRFVVDHVNVDVLYDHVDELQWNIGDLSHVGYDLLSDDAE